MRLTYCLLRNISSKNLLRSIQLQGAEYGFGEPSARKENARKTVIVEYSSPNIAKPFHVGHLRSTILGNFIANLYAKLGWKVVRLNYLGDWGTQFGLLAVGFQKFGSEDELQKNPLHHLLEVYVKINQEVAQEKTSGKADTFQAGLEAFRKMEQGDETVLKLWQRFKDISIEEYSKLYKRLGVSFTEYHFESMYEKAALNLIQDLKHRGLAKLDQEGRSYMEVENNNGKTERVNLLKSDGTTLYLTRDIAAILDRHKKYRFDKIHYVVENAQHDHFANMQAVMARIPNWNHRLNDDIHIKFGRIEGISTRKGNIVFLKDLLDEAKNRIKADMLSKESTKVEGADNIERIAEELGKSAIITQDLGQRRLKNYKFNWDRVQYSTKLQYCHARLCSIERTSGLAMAEDFEEEYLTSNSVAVLLLDHLSRFEEVVSTTFSSLESYHVVQYLDQLCDHVNAAYRTCNVKQASVDVGQAYLQMFLSSKITLGNGLSLLGLEPLEKM